MLTNKVHWLDEVSCYAHDKISGRTYNLDKLIEFLDGIESFHPTGDDKEWFLKAADVIDWAMHKLITSLSDAEHVEVTYLVSDIDWLWQLKNALQEVGEMEVQNKSNQSSKKKEDHA